MNTNILSSAVLLIVAPIDHVYGTLDLVRALTTQEYTDRSGIREKIEGKGSFTLFAPSNEAWENLDRVSKSIIYPAMNTLPSNQFLFFAVFPGWSAEQRER